MPELPGRPNIGQLRRQARELLRAAAGAEPAALARIRAFSDRVSLSAAQLAVAREYGFASWPALHAEVQRRLAELRFPGKGAGPAEARWSFGGASPVQTVAGTLYPGGLVAGAGHAFLDASLMPASETQDRLAVPPPPISSRARAAHARAIITLAKAISRAVALTDDQGTTYALHVEDIQHYPDQSRERGPVSLRLAVDPVPARERRWLELRGRDGSAARLAPSADPGARVSRLAPAPASPAARELPGLALDLISPQFLGAGPEAVERPCADGPSRHLDLSVAFPGIDDTVVRADSLISEPETWRVYLRAEPGWWSHSPDPQRIGPAMSVAAEDDLGGMYVSQYYGGRSRGDHEELTMRFHPRLNPLARSLMLTFSHAGEQVTLELQLP
jgi:hypothetical protein